jgi:hypothetical protein
MGLLDRYVEAGDREKFVRHYWRKMGYGEKFRAMLDEANDTEKAARRVLIKPLKTVLSARQEPR